MKRYQTYQQIRADLVEGSVSCNDLVRYHLSRIAELNSTHNAFLEVFEEEALERAEQVDQRLRENKAGRLAGLVVGIKDLFCYKEHTTSCSSRILENFESQITATSIRHLIEEDAIVIGRQNCDEFAMGSSNENSAFGPVRNGANADRVPGGSSGGSAVAVQLDMCHVSLGSDTGGSVRQPAAFCGVVGLKPTYSRISRYGLTAYASSFDCVGVLSKSVEDAALVLEVIAGKDPLDSTSSSVDVDSYTNLMSAPDSCRIAILDEIGDSGGLEPDVNRSYSEAIDRLKDDGHTVESISFPYLEFLLPTYYILTSAEASANLSRYDGMRYGSRANGQDLEETYKGTRTNYFGDEVLRRIMLGTFVLSASYHDAFYNKALKVRKLIKEFTENVLSSHDFILLPTTPTTAFKIGSKTQDPLEMYLSDLLTVQASVAGLPAISIPKGSDRNGMPIGLQLIAGSFQEQKLLSFSKYLKEL